MIESRDPRAFAVADDGVDPDQVPKKILSTGAEIPAIGLGTFSSDRYSGESVAEAVHGAIAVGYRHIDCAAVYGNEHLIGQALRIAMQNGLKREDLWITSKLWNDKHGEKDVIPACEQSLKDLQVDYLDRAGQPVSWCGWTKDATLEFPRDLFDASSPSVRSFLWRVSVVRPTQINPATCEARFEKVSAQSDAWTFYWY